MRMKIVRAGNPFENVASSVSIQYPIDIMVTLKLMNCIMYTRYKVKVLLKNSESVGKLKQVDAVIS